MKIVILYSPVPDQEVAVKLQQSLVESKLVACVNAVPVKSCYMWGSELTNDEEIVLIAKTLFPHRDEAVNLLKKMHPYDVPCILTWEVDANQEYVDWMMEVMK